ncbi:MULTISPECIES: hypothetical protein [unclassified Rhodococcus (in: high G+C Gram-positive bacteria)]|uniref:hypothetical protein n=1 Tax=unclassified Rhodococcus (in: high G+C Gram-positive bacteria) TaxID=192944 RepID=UPI000B3C6223|nr:MULTISPECIES: hypothetical protein [unclassified Rhodococcus (in: high G+C Gram-positive bacteria)]KAF0966765.1 hypothetical protein MLGJGCBP_00080 [Rhodococcus sp. T7]OUS89101.1 hypothetical protein CA951_37105 [Rhodococcus sp. NCIMB 12038]
MTLLTTTIQSLWQVVLVGLLFGAGLPAIFALGLRSLGGADTAEGTSQPTVAARIGAYACFAVVLIAIITGILLLMKDFLATSFGIHIF